MTMRTNPGWMLLTGVLAVVLGLGVSAQSTDIDTVPGRLVVKATSGAALTLFSSIEWKSGSTTIMQFFPSSGEAFWRSDGTFFLATLAGATRLAVRSDGILITSGGLLRPDGTALGFSLQNGANVAFGNFSLSSSDGLTTFVSVTSTAHTTNIPIRAGDGSASAPSYSFTNETNTGIFRFTSNSLDLAVGGIRAVQVSSGNPGNYLEVLSRASLTTQSGSQAVIGRNTAGSGAAGTLGLVERGGGAVHLWSDSGTLRIGSAAPTADDASPHSGGTIVGTQTSSLDSKILLGERRDNDRMLRELLAAPVYDFRYRAGGLTHETFTGVVTDFTPALGMDPDAAHPHGRSLNVINATGYTIGALKAIDQRLRVLEGKKGRK